MGKVWLFFTWTEFLALPSHNYRPLHILSPPLAPNITERILVFYKSPLCGSSKKSIFHAVLSLFVHKERRVFLYTRLCPERKIVSLETFLSLYTQHDKHLVKI